MYNYEVIQKHLNASKFGLVLLVVGIAAYVIFAGFNYVLSFYGPVGFLGIAVIASTLIFFILNLKSSSEVVRTMGLLFGLLGGHIFMLTANFIVAIPLWLIGVVLIMIAHSKFSNT